MGGNRIACSRCPTMTAASGAARFDLDQARPKRTNQILLREPSLTQPFKTGGALMPQTVSTMSMYCALVPSLKSAVAL